jgi:hypothetical protein
LRIGSHELRVLKSLLNVRILARLEMRSAVLKLAPILVIIAGFMILGVELVFLQEVHPLEPLILHDWVAFGSLNRCLEMTKLGKSHSHCRVQI